MLRCLRGQICFGLSALVPVHLVAKLAGVGVCVRGSGGEEVEQAYENNTLLELYTPLQSEGNPNIQTSNELMSFKTSTQMLIPFKFLYKLPLGYGKK